MSAEGGGRGGDWGRRGHSGKITDCSVTNSQRFFYGKSTAFTILSLSLSLSLSCRLTVRAYDLGTPSLHSDVPVTVFVTDRNDHAPVFEREVYRVSVEEDAPGGTQVARVRTAKVGGYQIKLFRFI